MTPKRDAYPDIADYAFISDCHSSALVSSACSIDWCCMPRFDSAPVFGRLLDWQRGGHCAIRPAGDYEAMRSYVDGTLVLQTVLHTDTGEAVLFDCITMRRQGATHPYRQLVRVVEGRRGFVDCVIEIAPRFDYASVRPWLRRHAPGLYSAIGGNDALVFACDVDLDVFERHDLAASFTVRSGQRVRLSLTSMPPEHIDPEPPPPVDAREVDRRLDATVQWWRTWGDQVTVAGPYAEGVKRSALVLKGLVNAPTGAVVAAATTSLPERVGGERNWDYRYTWVRDSHFTVRSLTDVGCDAEADGFRRFVERSAAGSVESLQIMYGVGGERRLSEQEITHLDGYRSSRPVRVGNAAAGQQQFDVFGELLDLAWHWHRRGRSPDDDYWRFLVSVVDYVADHWREPDQGIWEMRGPPQHFVFSKAMCWVALRRGIQLAERCMRRAPVDRWRAERDELRAVIDEHGFDEKLNSFVQTTDGDDVDASLLLLPAFEVVAYDDSRMIGTVDLVRHRLDDHGLLRRYRTDDALDGREGAFLACSFWLVECLARQGRLAEARTAFDRAVSTGNDVGLFSEEFDADGRNMLGNFPQALTHLSHITASLALTNAAGVAQVGLLGPAN